MAVTHVSSGRTSTGLTITGNTLTVHGAGVAINTTVTTGGRICIQGGSRQTTKGIGATSPGAFFLFP